MTKKHSRNLQKVQDMLDGKGTGKIISGYSTVEETHKVGDRWFDSDGKEWEQKEGYRSNITKFANRGIVDNKCSDCEKYITKPWDKEIFKFNNRCYYCQIDFEAKLKSFSMDHDKLEDQGEEFDEWKKKQDERIKEDYIERFEKENEELVKEIAKLENPFDTKVANALANGEVDITINKNTK
tara:strand:+ start:43 stop:588 length:546 start_codon:yes stop_codon:yes gene_type:complete